jgi:hypothetical protein
MRYPLRARHRHARHRLSGRYRTRSVRRVPRLDNSWRGRWLSTFPLTCPESAAVVPGQRPASGRSMSSLRVENPMVGVSGYAVDVTRSRQVGDSRRTRPARAGAPFDDCVPTRSSRVSARPDSLQMIRLSLAVIQRSLPTTSHRSLSTTTSLFDASSTPCVATGRQEKGPGIRFRARFTRACRCSYQSTAAGRGTVRPRPGPMRATNAIESSSARFRRATCTRGHFPTSRLRSSACTW